MKDGLGVNGFVWDIQILGPDGEPIEREIKKNLIPQAGLAFLLRAPFGDVSPISNFYLGLFTGNYIPTSATVAADIPSNMGECIDYSQATRPIWNRLYDGNDTLDNVASKAEFTFTQDRTILGAFLVSESTKGGNSGLVLSCVRFASPKPVTAGSTAQMSGGLTYIPTNVI